MSSVAGDIGGGNFGDNLTDHVKEFMKGAAEMSLEMARGCRDIVRQSLGNENSPLVKYLGKNSYVFSRARGPCARVSAKLKCFNDYLPEDKDPMHVWSVICIIFVLVLAGNC